MCGDRLRSVYYRPQLAAPIAVGYPCVVSGLFLHDEGLIGQSPITSDGT